MLSAMHFVFALLFPLRGRRSRGGYGRAGLAYTVALGAIWIVALSSQVRALGFLALLATALLLVSTYFIGAQRCRDLTLPGWTILAIYIPGLGFLLAIALLFIPGSRGANRYGPDPLDPFASALPDGAAPIVVSKPVFSGLFRASGRRNRKSYFLLHLAMLAVGLAWCIAALSAVADMNAVGVSRDDLPSTILVIQIAAFVIGLPLAVIGIFAMVQRCHDADRSGWWVLVSLVPLIGTLFWLALFLVPGTRGPNRYGPDPCEI